MKASSQRIVVGIDGIDLDHNPVLTAALEHAWWSRAELSLVHVLTAGLPFVDADAPAALAPRPARIQAVTVKLRQHLSEHLDDERPPTAVHLDVRYGDPATVLLMAAQQANLIVLGARDPRRPDRRSPFTLGSVSQDVATNATCAVLLVPTGLG